MTGTLPRCEDASESRLPPTNSPRVGGIAISNTAPHGNGPLESRLQPVPGPEDRLKPGLQPPTTDEEHRREAV